MIKECMKYAYACSFHNDNITKHTFYRLNLLVFKLSFALITNSFSQWLQKEIPSRKFCRFNIRFRNIHGWRRNLNRKSARAFGIVYGK